MSRSPLNLSPEERLLVMCAAPPELHDPERLSELAAGVADWQRFTEKALKVKFAPLVFARLSELNLKGVMPKPLFMQLAAAQVAVEGTNRRLLAERDRLFDAFSERGISALPLKGCALADTLYGDASLRPMGDLDLLFRVDEFDVLAGLLTGYGYQVIEILPLGETTFFHPETRFMIDAHTALDPSGRFRIPPADLWAEAAPLPPSPSSPGGNPPHWKTLSVRHHLVHGLLHATRHRLDSLGPLVDASWLASRWPGEIHWETLPDLARRWRCREALGFALEAASLLFGLPVPGPVSEKLRLRGWRRHAMRRLWPGESPLRSLEKRPASVRYTFSALTTSWPGGFFGATHRIGRTKLIHADE